jgi:CxxC motif-containing protein
MPISNSSKQSLVSTCNALITGITALPAADNVVSAGKTYTKAQLLAPLQAYVVLPSSTATAKTAYTKAVVAEGAAKAAAVAMIEGVIKPVLHLLLGADSPDLETYGLDPVKTPQKTVATKAAAIQKGQATRKALGTKGPVQKAAAKKALDAEPAIPATSPAVATPVKS